jgi:hypothetical protein
LRVWALSLRTDRKAHARATGLQQAVGNILESIAGFVWS